MTSFDRRDFLKLGISGLALAGPFQAFLGTPRAIAAAGYGAPVPTPDHTTGENLLSLPPGFEYWSFGEVGSPMSDGNPTPPSHDGMAAFKHRVKIRLVRNHEVRSLGPAIGLPGLAYDPNGAGGTTTVTFDPRNPGDIETFVSLSGTNTNCAGGRTPWGSWLTCEETVVEPVSGQTPTFAKKHGYVYEVPMGAMRMVPAVPLTALGRFVHEAVAVDPRWEIVYETEDANPAGIYRFVPAIRRKAKGYTEGELQMLAVKGQPNYDTRTVQTVGASLDVEWVTIGNPDPDLTGGELSCYKQGEALGGAMFSRPEGAFWSTADQVVCFNCTDGGDAHAGQVWAYHPASATLTLIYESPGPASLLKPDNIVVGPGGGILLCEDPDRAKQAYLRGLTQDGVIYDFAINNRAGIIPGTTVPMSWDEFAGATFSPDGKWLFVNIQTPGITFAITGPWEKGPLGKPPV